MSKYQEEKMHKGSSEHEEVNDVLDEMAKEMDKDFMHTGADLAHLFREICIASAILPEMELRTDLMEVVNNEEGLIVRFRRDRAEDFHAGVHKDALGDDRDNGEDDYNDEEGMLYDGD